MSVQARIHFFETYVSSPNAATTSASTIATNQGVATLVDFYEAFAASTMTTATRPRSSTSVDLLSTPGLVPADVPSTDQPIPSLPDTHDGRVASVLESNIADEKVPASESTAPLRLQAPQQATLKPTDKIQRSFTSRLRAPTKVQLPRLRSVNMAPIQAHQTAKVQLAVQSTVKAQLTAQATAERRSRTNPSKYQVQAGSRLFDFETETWFLRQVAESKERTTAAHENAVNNRRFSMK
ncbi:hypothetical protein PHYBOEH_001342 [Phytophthora boehmeriae]|uniref:Uncharacterized protein n=1 Tax=Phytophthora boehmeriae TaxID=109152 RepID=A0A8T1V707_9STRA|nr:hypothetical protein PHYBOEH_001342 [Phytophthora boehmeriae]